MKAVITKTTPTDPSIWCETNFVEYPYFVMGNKGSKETEILFQINSPQQKAIWKVENKSGLPGNLSYQVFTALEHLIDQNGLDSDGSLFFTIYQILQVLNWKSIGGTQYTAIKEAIKRLVDTTIVTEYTFLDKSIGSKARYKKFSVLLEYEFAESASRDGTRNELSRVQFNSTYLANRRMGYTSPISAKVFFEQLQSPLAKRLYQFLNKRAYHMAKRGEPFRIDSQEIGALMAIKSPFTSRILRTIERASKELLDVGFLQNLSTERIGRKSMGFVFAFNPAFQEKEKASRLHRAGGGVQAHSGILERLLSFGFTEKDASSLLDRSASSVRMALEQIDLDRRTRKRISSPAGFVRSFVEKGWVLPDYVQVQVVKGTGHDTESKSDSPSALTAQPEASENEIAEYIKSLTDEERISLNKETISIAIGSEGEGLKGSFPYVPETFEYFSKPSTEASLQHWTLRLIQKSLVSERISVGKTVIPSSKLNENS